MEFTADGLFLYAESLLYEIGLGVSTISYVQPSQA